MNFTSHIDYVVKKSTQKLGALAKVRKCVNRPTALMLYKSMILPHFDYCSIVYMHTSAANLNRLQVIQNSACRIIFLANRDCHVTDMHRTLKLTLLDTRRKVQLSIFIHRNVYPEIETVISDMYVPLADVTRRATRQSDTNQLKVSRVKTCYGQKSISYCGPLSWNLLPDELHCIKNTDTFKLHLNKSSTFLFENHPT